MSRTYVFADEAGNDDFNLDKRNATRYFILTAVTLSDCAIGDQLIALRGCVKAISQGPSGGASG